MAKSLTAYLLCAGHGMRLRPFTNRTPKPLVTFLGKTALELNTWTVKNLYPSRLICNVHHQWELVEREARRLGVDVIYENDILGTGGCLWNALHILESTDHFLIHNGDILHDIDVYALLAQHEASGNIATLAGAFRPSHNTLSCSEGSELLGIHGYESFNYSDEMTRRTFSGIAVYNREFLRYVKAGEQDIKRYWMDALNAGEHIGIYNISQESMWFDFGTPQGLWNAAKWVMDNAGEFSYRYNPSMRENRPYVSNEVGQDDLPDFMRNVLIYEETRLPIPQDTNNCILGMDFKWNIEP